MSEISKDLQIIKDQPTPSVRSVLQYVNDYCNKEYGASDQLSFAENADHLCWRQDLNQLFYSSTEILICYSS